MVTDEQVAAVFGRTPSTSRERKAVRHVLEVKERHGGKHSLNACPPATRAMCSYRSDLVKLKDDKGIEP